MICSRFPTVTASQHRGRHFVQASQFAGRAQRAPPRVDSACGSVGRYPNQVPEQRAAGDDTAEYRRADHWQRGVALEGNQAAGEPDQEDEDGFELIAPVRQVARARRAPALDRDRGSKLVRSADVHHCEPPVARARVVVRIPFDQRRAPAAVEPVALAGRRLRPGHRHLVGDRRESVPFVDDEIRTLDRPLVSQSSPSAPRGPRRSHSRRTGTR